MTDIVKRLRKGWINELDDEELCEAADEIERLRMLNAMTEVSHNQLASQIERLRTALEYIVEYCEETSLSREDKIAHTLRKASSALEEKE